MFGANNWFAFQDDSSRSKDELSPRFLISSPPTRHEDGFAVSSVSPPNSSGDSSSDDEVVLGEDEDLVDTATSASDTANTKFEARLENGMEYDGKESPTFLDSEDKELSSKLEKVGLTDNLSLFQRDEDNTSSFAGFFSPLSAPYLHLPPDIFCIFVYLSLIICILYMY